MGSTLAGLVTAAVLAGSAAGPVIAPQQTFEGLGGADEARIAPIQGSWARTKAQCGSAGGGALTIDRDRLTFGEGAGRICRIGRVVAPSLDRIEVHTSCDSRRDVPVTFRLAPGGDQLMMRQRVLKVRLERCR